MKEAGTITGVPFSALPAPGTFMFTKPRGQEKRSLFVHALSNNRMYLEFARKYQPGPAPVFDPAFSFLHPGGQHNVDLSFSYPMVVFPPPITPLPPVVALLSHSGHPSPALDSPHTHIANTSALTTNIFTPGAPDFVSTVFSALFSTRYSVSNLNHLLNRSLSYSASPMELVMHHIAARVVRSASQLTHGSKNIANNLDSFNAYYSQFNRIQPRIFETFSDRHYHTLVRKIAHADFNFTREQNVQHADFTSWFPYFNNLTVRMLRNTTALMTHTAFNSLQTTNLHQINNELNALYIKRANIRHTDDHYSTGHYNDFNINRLDKHIQIRNIEATIIDRYNTRKWNVNIQKWTAAIDQVLNQNNYTRQIEQNRWMRNRIVQEKYTQQSNIQKKLIRHQHFLIQKRDIHIEKLKRFHTIVNPAIDSSIINNNTYRQNSSHYSSSPLSLRNGPAREITSTDRSLHMPGLVSALFRTRVPVSQFMHTFRLSPSYSSSPFEAFIHQTTRRALEENLSIPATYHKYFRAVESSSNFSAFSPHDYYKYYNQYHLHQDTPAPAPSWREHFSVSKHFTAKDAPFVSNLVSALFSSSYRLSNFSFAFKKTLSYTASPMEIILHGITKRVLTESFKTQKNLREQEIREEKKLGTVRPFPRTHLLAEQWTGSRIAAPREKEPTPLEQLWQNAKSPDSRDIAHKTADNREPAEFPYMAHQSQQESQLPDETFKQIEKKIMSETKQIQTQMEKKLFSSLSASPITSQVNLSHLADGVYSKIVDRIKHERRMRGY